MDIRTRQSLVRRIITAKLYGTVKFQQVPYPVFIQDPTPEILMQADHRYQELMEAYVARGVHTIEQSYQILRERGDWTDKMESDLIILRKDVEEIKKKLPNLRFQKALERATKATLEEGKKRIAELEAAKNQLAASSAEYMADNGRRRYIMSKITTIQDNALWDNPNFLDALVVYYYHEAALSESTLRLLARSDPWRLYWTVSKNTGTSLFPHSAVEMTELQYALVAWSQVYDFAYESMNRPPDDVIDDDDKFDAWYQSESERIQTEIKKKSLGDGAVGHSQNFIGGKEVFIPADTEGAREVYQLNDSQGKARVAMRQKAIMEKGDVTEANLPDVKKDLVMMINQAASQAAQTRSK